MSADEQQVQRIAEDIVVGHARHRRRTRWAVVAGAAIAVTAAVPLAVVLRRPVTDGRPVSLPERASTAPSRVAPLNTAAAPVADDARIYAAVLRDWRPSGALRIYQRVCNSDGVCSAGPATAGLRHELGELLDARARFVPHPMGAVALQAVHIHGASASARVEENCGPMCVSGERAHLTRVGSDWQLTGGAVHWIS